MTQKEYTGPEFRLEFKRADYEWEKGGRVGPDPRTQWQCKNNSDWDKEDCKLFPLFVDEATYRWKPIPKRMVTIGYESHCWRRWISKTLVAPEVEAPAMGTVFYRYKDPHHVQRWCGGKQDYLDLETGEIFLAREDAQAMSDWLAVYRKGGQS